jgi:hypothetical protein
MNGPVATETRAMRRQSSGAVNISCHIPSGVRRPRDCFASRWRKRRNQFPAVSLRQQVALRPHRREFGNRRFNSLQTHLNNVLRYASTSVKPVATFQPADRRFAGACIRRQNSWAASLQQI